MDKSKRLMSLDALRGADMLCIMGGSSLVVALCALFGATHVAWHGFRHHDTIFPLFLFLAGVSWPYSLAGQQARGRSTAAIVRKILVRMVLLIILGFASSTFFAFDFANVRYAQVLGHIGIGWAVAALLALFVRSVAVRMGVLALILVGYWALLAFVPAPDAAALLASTDPAIAKKVASYAAYGTDGDLQTRQMQMLFDDMKAEYAKGNYVIAGGDWNHDFTGDSKFKLNNATPEDLEALAWCAEFPADMIPEGFSRVTDYKSGLRPSTRNTDIPYSAESFVVTLDGFIVSDNVDPTSVDVVDTGFLYSDHNPVEMKFVLK